MSDRARLMGLWVGGALVTLALGVGIGFNLDIGMALGVALLVAAAAYAPAGSYVLVVLVATLTFKGLSTIGVLPPLAVFVDIPLAWSALALALVRRRGWSREASLIVRWLAVLGVAVTVSWAASPTDALRPLFYFALLGQPFAIVAALLIDPPSRLMARTLAGTAMALLLVQIPLAYLQAQTAGSPDRVQGTLAGAGAGAHTISAVIVVGIIWLLATLPRGAAWRLPAVALLLPIPLVADAKQVLFMLPAVLLVGRGGQGRLAFVLRLAGVGTMMGLLLLFTAGGRLAVTYVERSVTEQTGKVGAAGYILDRLRHEPGALLVGLGPAMTVSRSAYMTTDDLLREESPLRAFNLKPATFPDEMAREVGGFRSSFASGLSSGLGVLGDLGLLGIVAYLGLLVTVFVLTRRVRTPLGIAAASGWAIFAPLGLIYDWWEQPPFGVFIAVLSGLALADEHARRAEPTDESVTVRT